MPPECQVITHEFDCPSMRKPSTAATWQPMQLMLTPRVDADVQNQITHTHTQRPQADVQRWLADAAAHATPQGGHSLLYAARRRGTAALCKRALATHAATCKIKRSPAPCRCIELRATALPCTNTKCMGCPWAATARASACAQVMNTSRALPSQTLAHHSQLCQESRDVRGVATCPHVRVDAFMRACVHI